MRRHDVISVYPPATSAGRSALLTVHLARTACVLTRFLPARRYVIAHYCSSFGFGSVHGPSVCLSVTSRYCLERAKRIRLGFGTEASFDLPSRKIRVLLSETLSQTLNFKKNCHTTARRSSQRVVVNLAPFLMTLDDPHTNIPNFYRVSIASRGKN